MHPEWMEGAAPAEGAQKGVSRRGFMKASALAGGGLVLGFVVPESNKLAQAATPKAPVSPPNAFLRVAPDNTVTVMVNRLEFGQGVHTSLPMLIAEELDADWSRVRAELAPAGDVFKDPRAGMQMTGGSGSVRNSFMQYRLVGARARAMLVSAAASQWKVDATQCRTSDGFVLGPAGQKASYGSLANAAMRLPVPETVGLKDPKDFRLIGRATPRIDARAKSTGAQQFGMDFKPAGCKVAVVARPPVFGGRVKHFDASAARSLKGVIDVLVVDVDRAGSGVAVIADGYWPARQAREALKIEWDTSGVGKTDSAAQMAQFRERAKQRGAQALKADTSALAKAAKRISAVYEFPYLAHAPMEPLNCVVDLKDDECTVWTGTQFQTGDHAAVVRTTGLPADRVRLNTMMAGGGFGRRAVPSSDYVTEAVNVARASRKAGHGGLIKLIWSREDDIRGGYYRPSHVHRAEIGLDAGGNIVAWDHVIVGQSIMAGTPFEKFAIKDGVDNAMVEGMGRPYAVPLNLTVHNEKANVPVLWWRSVGSTHTAYVMETLIDEAAAVAGVDPVAYRRKLIDPSHKRHLAALDLAVEKSGYGRRKLPAGHAWGVAMHESFNTVVAYVVEASVKEGVPVLHKATAGVHCNLAVNPLSVAAQVEGAALMALGTTLPGAAITLKDGVVEQKNFDGYTVARMNNMPQVDVFIVPSADPPTGIGEPGLPPLAPALANAVARLTGKRLRKLPFDLQQA